jgi:hypothetical protein
LEEKEHRQKANVEEKKTHTGTVRQQASRQAGREKREEKRLVEAMTINKKKKSITYYIKAYFQGELTTEKKSFSNVFFLFASIELNLFFFIVFFHFSLPLSFLIALCCCCCCFADDYMSSMLSERTKMKKKRYICTKNE